MRVYVPLTLPALRAAHQVGELAPAPDQGSGAGPRSLVAYAVTPRLRERQASEDTEELEYAALNRAALAALRLLVSEPGAVRRRVVLALDAADADVDMAAHSRDGAEAALGEVRVKGPLPLSKAAAVHVDAEDAEREVLALLQRLGEPGSARGVAEDAEEGPELLWYATQEIPYLLG
jgi:hypothetical protein